MADLDTFKNIDLVIDSANSNNLIPRQFSSVGDISGRTLTVQVAPNGVPASSSGAILRAVWTNLTSGITSIDDFEEVDTANGIYIFTYPEIMNTRGTVEMAIQIYFQDKVTTTRKFNIDVQGINGNFSKIIQSQQFQALTVALNEATKANPRDFFNSVSELQAAFPQGSTGTYLVKDNTTNIAKTYMWKNGSWQLVSDYQGLILSKSESDKLISKNQSLFNWIDNSILNKDLTIPYQAQDGATGSIVERNDKKWFQIIGGVNNTKRQQIICRINKDSDKYYYGGDGEITIRNESPTSVFNIFINVITSTNSAQIPCFSTIIVQNDQNSIKFTVPPLSKSNFNFEDIKEVVFTIRTENQDNVKYMISEHKIYTNSKNKVDFRNETKQKEIDLNNKLLINQTNTLDLKNWISNSLLLQDSPIPYQAQDGMTREIIDKGKFKIARFVSGSTNSGKQKIVIPLDVKVNSDRFYYGGSLSVDLKSPNQNVNLAFRVLLTNQLNQERYIEIGYYPVYQNQQVTFLLDFPKLSEYQGFSFDELKSVLLIIQPTEQINLDIQIGQLSILTKSSYTINEREERKQVIKDSEVTTLNYNNWIKNSSLIGTILPFQAQDGLKGEVIQKSSRNWYQVSSAGSHTNRQKLAVFPTVVDDSDKYYYGGEGQFIIRNEAESGNFDVFVTVYTKTNEKQFLINRFYLLPNKNLLFKFIVPKLSESGFIFQDVTQVVISIRPENQETVKFRVTDMLIKTIPSYVRDVTVQELPSFDAKKSIFPRVDLSGDFNSLTSTGKLMMPFRYQNQEFVVEGVSETKWQGNSSKNLPKKNIRIKLYDDEQKTNKKKVQLNQSFPKTEKYNLKANYIDRFHVRNLMNSMLSYQMFATRTTISEPIDNIPFGGQIKGFPCVVYINNEFYGLFTFNTAKDSDMLALSNESSQLAIQGFLNSRGAKFYEDHVTVAVDGATEDFEILFPEKIPDEAQQADIDRLFTFVNSSADVDFKNNFNDYYDLTSVIDWMLLIDATAQTDMNGKNIIHVTYDRKKWFAVPYDQDNSYGVHFTGETETDTDFNILDPENDINKLFKRVLKNFPDKITERYDSLVQRDILTVTNVQSLYRNFIDLLPQNFVEMDQRRWPQNKSYSILDYERTMFLIAKRFKLMEEHINKLR